MLSSVTMNDLAHYSNNAKNLKFAGTSSMNDLQSCNDMIKTPIRLNKLKLSTPGSIQRRRALGLVNNNNPNPTEGSNTNAYFNPFTSSSRFNNPSRHPQ